METQKLQDIGDRLSYCFPKSFKLSKKQREENYIGRVAPAEEN